MFPKDQVLYGLNKKLFQAFGEYIVSVVFPVFPSHKVEGAEKQKSL